MIHTATRTIAMEGTKSKPKPLAALRNVPLKNSADFDALSDYVADSGEGRWTIVDSIELGVPTPVITLATQMRFFVGS